MGMAERDMRLTGRGEAQMLMVRFGVMVPLVEEDSDPTGPDPPPRYLLPSLLPVSHHFQPTCDCSPVASAVSPPCSRLTIACRVWLLGIARIARGD